MSEVISKELLGEVLRSVKNVTSVYKLDSRTVVYTHKPLETKEQRSHINIYELAHKCKEWASKEGYCLDIYRGADGHIIEVGIIGEPCYLHKPTAYNLKDEPEAIFKACQWILENK